QQQQQQQLQQQKKKRKFSLFKLFRKKSRERHPGDINGGSGGGGADGGVSSATEAAPVPAVAASYHQHLGNGGLRAQVTSQCTCHVRVTTGAEATVGQSRISHCILHGNREWHGGGDGGGFAVKVPAAAAADSGVPESLSYQQLFPISNPYHSSPMAAEKPRLYRTRSDESLSMSEFKVKTQKEKLRAFHDRQETWRAAAAASGAPVAPQTGRRGAYQQQQQQQSPGANQIYSE
uniref:CG11233 n=2 Tax=Macrostomum lignano TaxID=282301 RepID=A0A1I8I146_9PLAT